MYRGIFQLPFYATGLPKKETRVCTCWPWIAMSLSPGTSITMHRAWRGITRLHTCRESLLDMEKKAAVLSRRTEVETERKLRRWKVTVQPVQQAVRSKAFSTAIRKMPTLAIQTQDKNFYEFLTEFNLSHGKCIRITLVDVDWYSLVELVPMAAHSMMNVCQVSLINRDD